MFSIHIFPPVNLIFWNAKLKPRLHFSIEVQYCCIFSGFQIQTIVMTQSWQHPGIIKSMNRALKGEQACTQCNSFKTSFFPIELLSTMGEKREANIRKLMAHNIVVQVISLTISSHHQCINI